MKILNLILVLLASPVLAWALDPRVCSVTSANHTLTLQEVADGVQATFEQSSLVDLPDLGSAPAYEVSGKTSTVYVVKNITLTQIMSQRSPLIDVLVSMIYSRPEYDGEEDMAYAYANEYTKGIVCK